MDIGVLMIRRAVGIVNGERIAGLRRRPMGLIGVWSMLSRWVGSEKVELSAWGDAEQGDV